MVWLKVLNGKGNYHDDRALQDALNYCMRESKTPNGLVGGWAVDPQNAAEEMALFTKLAGKEEGLQLRHFVISFPPKTFRDHRKGFEIAKRCAQYYGENHQIVYAIHEDTEHVHAHFVMNAVRYTDGKKYRGTKQDLYAFTAHGTKVLHDAGIKSSLAYISTKRRGPENSLSSY